MNQQDLEKTLQFVVELSIDHASQVLSKTLNSSAKIHLKDVSTQDISLVTEKMNEDDYLALGAFIGLEGTLPFKFLFFVEQTNAFTFTDMMLRKEVGTTKISNPMVTSVVQEIGNILSSSISNTFVNHFQIAMQPTPPLVLEDYVGSIFSEFIMETAMEQDNMLLIESVFELVSQEMKCHMFLLPDRFVYERLQQLNPVSSGSLLEKTESDFRILVVDDMVTDRKLFQKLLGNKGYVVDTAIHGKDALQKLEQASYDLVLCDYLMPEMDGLQTLKEIRKNDFFRDLIVIIITSDESNDVRIKLLNEGANDFVQKGILIDELYARIKTHLIARDGHQSLMLAQQQGESLEKMQSLLQSLKGSLDSMEQRVAKLKSKVSKEHLQSEINDINEYVSLIESHYQNFIQGGEQGEL